RAPLDRRNEAGRGSAQCLRCGQLLSRAMMPRAESHVLVTGVTGFLGKVVLEALVRRADELGVTRIYLLIRPKRDRTPQERFTSEVVASDCFRLLPEQWEKRCTVVLGNVTDPDLALSAVDEDILIEHVTHIINC